MSNCITYNGQGVDDGGEIEFPPPEPLPGFILRLKLRTKVEIYRPANCKTGKQALIAVMNKLLKQVFAVAKNGTIFQPNYCSVKP